MDSLGLEEELLHSILSSPTDVAEVMNCASGRSSLLCQIAIDRFLRCVQKRDEFGTLDLVFHRTQESTLDSISHVGFVAPDGNKVKVANGNRYGPGIYTTWQDSPEAWKRYGPSLVLCLAYRGEERPAEENLQLKDGVCSRVVEQRQSIVYRHGCQVLPIAVVDESNKEVWQLADIVAAKVFDMAPLVRGHWVTKSRPVKAFVRKLALQPVSVPARVDERYMYKQTLQQWTAAEKFLSMDRRLQIEMSGVKELVGEACIRKVERHTFQNSLEQWEAKMQRGDETLIRIGLAFPMCYPKWPPHIFLVEHRPHGKLEVVCRHGGINALKLMGVSSWEPAILVKDLLKKLRPIIAENCWVRQVPVPSELSIASFCGDGKDFWARFQNDSVTSSHVVLPNEEPQKRQRTEFLKCQGGLGLLEEFREILEESVAVAAELGGAPNFPNGEVTLIGKVTRREFHGTYTAFEHLQLTVLGFARLRDMSDEVLRLNNGKKFFHNPGTLLLERECGLTMHADHPGATEAVKTGPDLMLTVFAASQKAGRSREFFTKAFDRHHDPCLEGRFSLIQDFGQELFEVVEELPLSESS